MLFRSLRFRHADGTPYGERAASATGEPRIAAATRASAAENHANDAMDALRRMGVAPGDARRAVTRAAASGAASLEEFLRQALIHLRRTTYASCAADGAAGLT